MVRCGLRHRDDAFAVRVNNLLAGDFTQRGELSYQTDVVVHIRYLVYSRDLCLQSLQGASGHLAGKHADSLDGCVLLDYDMSLSSIEAV